MLNRTIVVRRLSAGILAGASTVVTVVVVFALLMLGSGLVGTLYTLSAHLYGNLSPWQALRVTMNLDLGVFIFVVWSGRLAFPGLCLLGLLLAAVELSSTRVRLRGRYHLGLCVTLGVLAAIIFGFEFARYAEPNLLLGTTIALIGTWSIWAGWATWYYLWVLWLHALPPHAYGPAVAPPVAKEFLAAQARIAWLKRPTPPDEPNPFHSSMEIVLPTDGLWTRPVFALWVGTSLLVALLWWSTGGKGFNSLAIVVGLVSGSWFALGALLLIELLAALNWLDTTAAE
jgi:hypothetical protein